MTRFSKLVLDAAGKPVETDVREIKQSDMMRCSHFIMVADHYRANGTCKCDDPGALEMRSWGYKWSRAKGVWVA